MQVSPYIFVGLSDPPELNNLEGKTEQEKVDHIFITVSNYTGIPIKELLNKRGQNSITSRPLSNAKKLVCYYLRTKEVPLKAVERCYPDSKGYDHATISHNYREVKGFIDIGYTDFIKFVKELDELI